MSTPELAAPQKERKTIKGLLEDKNTALKIRQIIPAHLNPERLLRVFAMAVYKTPKLAECDPVSLLGAMMACASFGLEPNTPLGHAYLIPFEKKKKEGAQWVTERIDVNLIIGYRGLIDLARRSGDLVSLHADVVYEGDDFSFEYGSNMHLRHVPKGSREGRKAIYCYAHASLKDGQAFEVLPNEEVLRVRDNAEAYKSAVRMKNNSNSRAYETSPWVAYEHEMKAKTMIRRLSKMLPMSIEFANAVALDNMSEANKVNFAAYADGEQGQLIETGFIENENDLPPPLVMEVSAQRMPTIILNLGAKEETVTDYAQAAKMLVDNLERYKGDDYRRTILEKNSTLINEIYSSGLTEEAMKIAGYAPKEGGE